LVFEVREEEVVVKVGELGVAVGVFGWLEVVLIREIHQLPIILNLTPSLITLSKPLLLLQLPPLLAQHLRQLIQHHLLIVLGISDRVQKLIIDFNLGLVL